MRGWRSEASAQPVKRSRVSPKAKKGTSPVREICQNENSISPECVYLPVKSIGARGSWTRARGGRGGAVEQVTS